MKITGYEATTLRIPEDDPLANMPEEAGRTRPDVILRLRADGGLEGLGLVGDAVVRGVAIRDAGEDAQGGGDVRLHGGAQGGRG